MDKIIIKQIQNGKLYIGEFAGSIILASNTKYVKDIDNDTKAPKLDNFLALNIVDFYPLPHHKNFSFKEEVEKIIEKYNSKLSLCPISNKEVILVMDGIYKGSKK